MKTPFNENAPFYQTGDVLYEVLPTNVEVEGLEFMEGNVIHKGINNTHTIDGVYQLFKDKDGSILIAVMEESLLRHGEHKPIRIPVGFYLKDIVNIRDHLKEETRALRD